MIAKRRDYIVKANSRPYEDVRKLATTRFPLYPFASIWDEGSGNGKSKLIVSLVVSSVSRGRPLTKISIRSTFFAVAAMARPLGLAFVGPRVNESELAV
jgi:hypothetical protein